MYPKFVNPGPPVSKGDPYRFRPSAFTNEDPGGGRMRIEAVTGKVIFIHATHRFFTVEFEAHGQRLRESFKF